jgi:hypothetical protein
MKEPTYEIDLIEDGRYLSPVSFMLGIGAGFALGVVGTVLFATYKEDHFTKVVRKTREISDSAQDTAGQLKDKFGDLTEAAKKQINKASGKLDEGIKSLHNGDLITN